MPTHVYGTTTQACRHNPPTHFGSPNGAFPMTNGHYLITEINGDWVDEMDLAGTIFGSWHPPGVAYPSDSNEVAPGKYLTVDYSSPGQVETFDGSGHLLWRYAPTGAAALNHPSLALPLPNGDVICNDDHNHRVIVVDPKHQHDRLAVRGAWAARHRPRLPQRRRRPRPGTAVFRSRRPRQDHGAPTGSMTRSSSTSWLA